MPAASIPMPAYSSGASSRVRQECSRCSPTWWTTGPPVPANGSPPGPTWKRSFASPIPKGGTWVTPSLTLDCRSTVIDVSHSPLLVRRIVGHCPVTHGVAVGMHVAAYGQLGLQFAHAGLYLAGVDGGPYIFGPVVVNGMRVIVVEKHVAEVGLVAVFDGADGRCIQACVAR